MQLYQKIIRNEDGVAAIELALIMPVMFLSIFGCAELLVQTYTRSNMQMLVSKAARESIVGKGKIADIESRLRSKIEILPGVFKDNDLKISICQKDGCGATTATVAEYVDNGDKVCNAPGGVAEQWHDYNRNGIPELAGTVVTGNALGGPNEPIIFEVKAKARFIFGSLSFLGALPKARQIQYFTVTAVGANEDFEIEPVSCTG
jgi:Flp pilus assembly protein TadG